MTSPIKADTAEVTNANSSSGGNTSMDTGVSSDLSESRPSLIGDDDDDEDAELTILDESIEGGEEEEHQIGGEGGSDGAESGRHSADSAALRQRRIKRRTRKGRDDDEDDATLSKSGGRKRQRLMQMQNNGGNSIAPSSSSLSSSNSIRNQQQRISIRNSIVESAAAAVVAATAAVNLKCPECGNDSFAGRTQLIHHLELAHPAALALVAAAAAATASIDPAKHLSTTTATSSGQTVNQLLQDRFIAAGEEAEDEYENEHDDPFTVLLRDMKMKAQFPCRLCTAVFTNLGALKGKISFEYQLTVVCCVRKGATAKGKLNKEENLVIY